MKARKLLLSITAGLVVFMGANFVLADTITLAPGQGETASDGTVYYCNSAELPRCGWHVRVVNGYGPQYGASFNGGPIIWSDYDRAVTELQGLRRLGVCR